MQYEIFDRDEINYTCLLFFGSRFVFLLFFIFIYFIKMAILLALIEIYFFSKRFFKFLFDQRSIFNYFLINFVSFTSNKLLQIQR